MEKKIVCPLNTHKTKDGFKIGVCVEGDCAWWHDNDGMNEGKCVMQYLPYISFWIEQTAHEISNKCMYSGV